MYKIEVLWGEDRKTITANKGDNLLKRLKSEGMDIPSPCGGKCFCGKCKVQIVEGKTTKQNWSPGEIDHLSTLERNQGYRLACGVNIMEDLCIRYGNGKKDEAAILVDGISKEGPLLPSVKKFFLELPKPSIDDQRSDVERLRTIMERDNLEIPKDILGQLPKILRESDYTITVTTLNEKVLDIEPGNTTERIFGIAVDIGTTTMVGYLMDLKSGRQLDVYSTLNPQGAHGADVITRSDYTIENENGLTYLSDLISNEINHMIKLFSTNQSIKPEEIYHITIVGNTIMMHIFAELPVKNIAVSPFIPVYSKGFDEYSSKLKIHAHPNARVSLLPCVAGYVGADTISAVMASGMDQKEEISLMIDIGTNGEIALGNKERMVTCSTAAGPAFEGAHIKYGLGGVVGAINKIEIKDKIAFSTIGGDPARGICGSGIVDAVSEMKDAGIIDMMGRIQSLSIDDELSHRIQEVEGKPAFCVATRAEGAVEDIYICQKDLREVQLAKAAIASGIRILMKDMGISFDDIAHVYLAGGFGNYIDYTHACNIGLLPIELEDKLISIGNGAGVGAKMALLSSENLERTENVRQHMHYIELSTRMDFQEIFVDMLMF